jgi:hypothetical protein
MPQPAPPPASVEAQSCRMDLNDLGEDRQAFEVGQLGHMGGSQI